MESEGWNLKDGRLEIAAHRQDQAMAEFGPASQAHQSVDEGFPVLEILAKSEHFLELVDDDHGQQRLLLQAFEKKSEGHLSPEKTSLIALVKSIQAQVRAEFVIERG